MVDVAEADEKAENKLATGAGLTAGVLVLFLFIRILAVSGWNWDVAAEIAESFDFGDSVAIIFGTLFERPMLTGAVITLVLPLAIFRLFVLIRKDNLSTSFTDWFVVATLVATQVVLVNSFEMWWAVVAPLALALGLILTLIYLRKYGRPGWFSRLGEHAGSVLVIAILALAVTVDTPWAPEEEITTKTGVVYGHVLEVEPGFLRVLTDDREVVILTDSDIVSRSSAR